MSNPRKQTTQSGVQTVAQDIRSETLKALTNFAAGEKNTVDILKNLAVDLLRNKAADATIKKNDPVVVEYIILDVQAAKLNNQLNTQNDVGPLRDTANAGLAKLGTVTTQPQAKQLSLVYREQFNGLDQEATKILQGRLEMIKQLRELIELQQARIVNLLKRTQKTHDMKDQTTVRDLFTLGQDLKGMSSKIKQFLGQQKHTETEIAKLANMILSAIPPSDRRAANLPEHVQETSRPN